MIECFLNFCLAHNMCPLDPSIEVIISYLEYLTNKLVSHKSVANYWSAVKFLHKSSNVHLTHAGAFEVALMLRAIPLTKRHVSQQKLPLSKTQMSQM